MKRRDSSPLHFLFFILLGLCFHLCAGLAIAEETGRLADESLVEQPRVISLVKKETRSTSSPAALTGSFYEIKRPQLGLLGSFEFDEEITNSRGNEQSSSVYEFRQGFILATQGWLYHPKFFQFDLQVEPQWSQIEERGDGPKSDEKNFFLPAYDVDGYFFAEKPVNLHVFANRYEDNLVSAFSSQSSVELDSYGASVSLNSDTLPIFLRYQHLDRTQEGFFLSEEERDDYRMDMYHQGGGSSTRLNLQYIDSLQTSDGSAADVQNSFNRLSNTWRLANDPTRRLTSTLQYNRTDDRTFSSSFWKVQEQLYYTHRKNLWSNSTLLYTNREINEFTEEEYSLGSELSHLLYENLTTSLRGNISRIQFPENSEDVYDTGLRFDYLRDIPWGSINALAAWDTAYTERSGDTTQLAVSNERVALTAGNPAFLGQESVDPDSIRVTDVTATRIYIRDQDYFVERLGNSTRIRRSIFGAIESNEVVLVSYRFTGDTGFDDNIFSQSYGATAYLFSTIRLSYNYFNRYQDILSGTEPLNPVDDTIHRTVFQLFMGLSETRVSYEDFSTSTSPSRTSWRAEEIITVSPSKRWSLQLSGYFGETRFDDGIDTEELYGATANILLTPISWTRAGIEGWLDRVSGEREDTGVTGLLSFVELYYGKWRCNMSYRFRETDDNFRDFQRTEHNLLVKLIRDL